MGLVSTHEMYFSYGQLFVYDASIPGDEVGLDWTEPHSQQGFARRDSVVSFGTILDFGTALVRVYDHPYVASRFHHRVIAVPFDAVTGKILIEGPEEIDIERSVQIGSGHYELTVAQQVVSQDIDADVQEVIDVHFAKISIAIKRSHIVLADSALQPPDPLVETANTAKV